MEEKTWEVLELEKILQRLQDCCSSPLGKELALHLRPTTDIQEVQRRQAETGEACDFLRLYPDCLPGVTRDIRPWVERAAAGATLKGEELLAVAGTLNAGRRFRKAVLQAEGPFPLLKGLAARVGDFRRLEEEIAKAVGEDGEVKDEATPRLFQLRRRIRSVQEEIKARLDSYLRSPEMQKYLQDNIYTVRGNRYVLPVKQEYRHQVPGLIHDQSASGATLFIEPMALVELNNELRRLLAAEEQEVEAVLAGLSRMVGEAEEPLLETLEALGRLDFILAKGILSQRMEGVPPAINNSGRWRIQDGRHPLLSGEVVPVTLYLGEDFDILVITGPNTGGKTVTLKTIGLFTLMAQCGLHLPARQAEISGSSLVFADIGDEQSIEQSLSTFSSHMSHIVSLLHRVEPGSLVLLDEIGAGTDPTEGAALAVAILDYLASLGAKVVATTHYSELKVYAYTTPRVENAAVEFDSRTLRPTFRLLIGTPGESNAFIIARRLGLPEEVVERAKGFLSEEQKQVGQMIRSLAEDRRASEQALREAEAIRREARQLQQQKERELEEAGRRAAEMVERAREEARSIVRRARTEVRELMKRLQQALAEEERQEKIKALHLARQQLASLSKEVEDKSEAYGAIPGGAPVSAAPGEEVWVVPLRQRGVILGRPGGEGEVTVQVGNLKVNLKVNELRSLQQGAREKKLSGGWKVLSAPAAGAVKPKIDLRGLTADEACLQADKYLDEVYLAGLKVVSLIHGKGTGALRTALHAYLRSHPLVKGFRFGGAGEGGSGVTIVELK
ncbi:endonuclease MutS2 [Thermanaeromonas sp. C210]|uniref:endonuclease MutS2 n=1 Tax=Thermanaeromonas sp. C210 TaxID=2731925 RepID=UPI00155C601E|nr:endonuclease MutS2 [Thermanaeromonas sp. C210]GFN23173.1 endonuclease MutS2 [Thermanaeromonas sp. C210]